MNRSADFVSFANFARGHLRLNCFERTARHRPTRQIISRYREIFQERSSSRAEFNGAVINTFRCLDV